MLTAEKVSQAVNIVGNLVLGPTDNVTEIEINSITAKSIRVASGTRLIFLYALLTFPNFQYIVTLIALFVGQTFHLWF